MTLSAKVDHFQVDGQNLGTIESFSEMSNVQECNVRIHSVRMGARYAVYGTCPEFEEQFHGWKKNELFPLTQSKFLFSIAQFPFKLQDDIK